MKLLVRAFVAALVLTGAVASIHATQTPSVQTLGKMTAGPLPNCPPDEPNGCGW
jgi:hypothetical protein